MSDAIKHECGLAFIRLRKPLSHYHAKYGTAPSYGINKLFLLMEKQHNRGQDGAGVASIKLDPKPGSTTSIASAARTSRPSRRSSAKIQKGYPRGHRCGARS
jgi:amidophosphoribosyltransferase